MRLIHTSDVHLGAYDHKGQKTNPLGELMEQGFARVIDIAIESKADGLLICGDFFDNDRVNDATVEYAGAQIARFPGRTYIVPGNHDPMDPGRIYNRFSLESMAPNLRIVRAHLGEYLEDPDLDLVVWGRAFLESDWTFRPLQGLPARLDDRWHVALAHGHYIPEGGFDTHRSLLMHQSEIAAAAGNWDYMAFGHWEAQADVSQEGVVAVYSGAPMAISGENRKAGWAAIVDFDDAGVRWSLEWADPRKEFGREA
jgi:DNA repair exonuclease SbcCD nuclease subunit